ncbi:MAG TPA: anti-sigma factor [Nonomuraea sp.]|nr:anti-sigma factor [Nonomuraea sp.]
MNDDLHTLSGAYAVHALPYAEWVLFEEHLRACGRCGAEVRRLRETAARLAEAVAEPPPAPLRARLLTAAHATRRPSHMPEGRPDESPTLWRRRGSRPPEIRAGRPPGGPAPHGSRAPVPASRMTGEGGAADVVPFRRRGPSRAVVGLAAVSAAAAVAFGAVALDARRDLGELAAWNEQVTAVLAAPDARTVRQPVTSGGTGTVVISRSAGRMMFTSSGLPALPASRAYELWLMGPDGPRPAGVLPRAEAGVTTPMLLTPLKEDDKVALTVEPAGGSQRPTTQPILLTRLPAA